jgi:hypothetical protein
MFCSARCLLQKAGGFYCSSEVLTVIQLNKRAVLQFLLFIKGNFSTANFFNIWYVLRNLDPDPDLPQSLDQDLMVPGTSV